MGFTRRFGTVTNWIGIGPVRSLMSSNQDPTKPLLSKKQRLKLIHPEFGKQAQRPQTSTSPTGFLRTPLKVNLCPSSPLSAPTFPLDNPVRKVEQPTLLGRAGAISFTKTTFHTGTPLPRYRYSEQRNQAAVLIIVAKVRAGASTLRWNGWANKIGPTAKSASMVNPMKAQHSGKLRPLEANTWRPSFQSQAQQASTPSSTRTVVQKHEAKSCT